MRQTPLKYKKELFDQVKKLEASFFGVPNTHYSMIESISLLCPYPSA